MRGDLFVRLVFVGILAGVGTSCSRQGAGSGSTSSSGGAESSGGSITGQQTNQAGPVMNFQEAPITDVGKIVDTSNSEAFWTRPVNLSGVTVQRILHDEGFILIGPDVQHAVLVQLDKSYPELREGQKVDVTGIIDPMGKDLSQWNVKPPDRQVFQGHTMFISATSVTRSGGK